MDWTNALVTEKIIPIRAGLEPIDQDPTEPEPDVVALLTELLEQAQVGRIRQIAVAFSTREHGGISVAGGVTVPLIGSVAMLQNHLLHCTMEGE